MGDMNENLDIIRSRVEQARKVLVRTAVFSTFTALLILGAGWLWGGTVLDYLLDLPAWTRWGAMLLSGTAAVVVINRFLVRPIVRYGEDLAAARSLEEASSELRDCLTTAIEYSGREDFRGLTSPEILAALLKDVRRRAECVEVDALLRRYLSTRAHLRRRFLAGGAAVLLFVLAGYLVPHFFGRGAVRLLMPWIDEPRPSFTTIEDLRPGNMELVRGTPVTLSARVEGYGSDSAQLEYRMEGGGIFEREMAGKERVYSYSFQTVMDGFQYRVTAGDSATDWYRISVYDPPRVESFHVSVTPPEYTGAETFSIPEGEGRIEAVAGSEAAIFLEANVEVGSLNVVYANRTFVGRGEGKKGFADFPVTVSGEYRVEFADAEGHRAREALVFPVEVKGDEAPEVTIVHPDKEEVSVSNDAVVRIRVAARDDLSLGELGLAHNLGYEEQRSVLRRYEPGVREDEAVYEMQLGLKGLKGGEVIAYYGYASDADRMAGPKESRSRLQFLVVYDEERYAGNEPPQQQQSESLKAMEELIERQKSVMRETFKVMDDRTGDAPLDALAGTERALQDDVKQLLNKMALDPRAAAADDEFEHLKKASEALERSSEALTRGDLKDALSAQGSALKHLSDVRRIVLTAGASSSLEDAAQDMMNQQRQQEQADRRNAEDASVKLPEMLDKHRRVSRDLARLDEPEPTGSGRPRDRSHPPERGRHLKRKAEEIRQLASESSTLSRNLAQSGSEPLRQASESLQEAEDNYRKAAEEIERAALQSSQQEQRDPTRQQDESPANEREISSARHRLEEAFSDLVRARARAQQSSSDLMERELTRQEGRAREIAREAEHLAREEQEGRGGTQMRQAETRGKAAELARDLSELAASPSAPPEARKEISEASAHSSAAAAAGHPRKMAEAARQAVGALRDARSRLSEDEAKRSEQLADAAEQLAANQRELARRAAPDERFRAAQQELRDETSSLKGQSEALPGKEPRKASRFMFQAVKEQERALGADSEEQAQETASNAAGKLKEAAQALRRDSQRRDADALRQAAKELKQALAALREQQADAKNRQPQTGARQQGSDQQTSQQQGREQGQQAQTNEKHRQQQGDQVRSGEQQDEQQREAQDQRALTGKQQDRQQSQQAQAGEQEGEQQGWQTQTGRQQAEQWGERPAGSGRGTWQGSSPEAQKHMQEAMDWLKQVRNERPMVDMIEDTVEPSLDQRASEQDGALSSDLSLREASHERAVRTGEKGEALRSLKDLASRLEAASRSLGQASQPSKESISAATAYLAEALRRFEASDEVVKELQEVQEELQKAARQPQSAPSGSRNLLERGIQRAYAGAVAEIERMEDERRPVSGEAVEVPEEYREAVKEYFRTLSED